MNREALSKPYRWLPNPWKVLDKLLFSEPFIEKFTTFEMKMIALSYAMAVGIFRDERANKNTRRFMIVFYIGCFAVILYFSIFYLIDLKVYDAEKISLGMLPITITVASIEFWLMYLYFYNAVKQIVEFIMDDYNCFPSFGTICSESAHCHNLIGTKKWFILLASFFFGSSYGVSMFIDIESYLNISSITTRRHLMKFFPMWCPFENYWIQSVMSISQNVLILPLLFQDYFGTILNVLVILETYNRCVMVAAKLNSTSERVFQRIEQLDNAMEETLLSENETIRSNNMKKLEEEKSQTVTMFYQDFVACGKRYQQLQWAQLRYKKVLNFQCSICFIHLLLVAIASGFIFSQALSTSTEIDLNTILTVFVWFLTYGGLWFGICVVGNLLTEENEWFTDEIYSIPWYLFSPKQRKTVLTFLTIIQKPICLRALNLVCVKMESFPDFLDKVYSNIQTLRTFQMLKNRET